MPLPLPRGQRAPTVVQGEGPHIVRAVGREGARAPGLKGGAGTGTGADERSAGACRQTAGSGWLGQPLHNSRGCVPPTAYWVTHPRTHPPTHPPTEVMVESYRKPAAASVSRCAMSCSRKGPRKPRILPRGTPAVCEAKQVGEET